MRGRSRRGFLRGRPACCLSCRGGQRNRLMSGSVSPLVPRTRWTSSILRGLPPSLFGISRRVVQDPPSASDRKHNSCYRSRGAAGRSSVLFHPDAFYRRVGSFKWHLPLSSLVFSSTEAAPLTLFSAVLRADPTTSRVAQCWWRHWSFFPSFGRRIPRRVPFLSASRF